MSYWSVPPIWQGHTVFILGCGPSLRGFDPTHIRGLGPVIVINDSFELIPYADCLYFCDRKWWISREEKVRRTFHGSCMVTLESQITGVHALRCSGQDGLELDPTALRTGSNSGYQAINLAVHFGAKKIILLGYDMRVDGHQMHWNIRPERQQPTTFQQTLNVMNAYFPTLKEPLEQLGITVINANPLSWLKVWPQQPLHEIVADLKPHLQLLP
jgi:hypothetical protein